MGFLSDYNKGKKEAEEKFKKNHPFLYFLASDNKSNSLKKRMDNYDLTEEERRAVIEDGYEPEDFEDEELEEDDYYFDEK